MMKCRLLVGIAGLSMLVSGQVGAQEAAPAPQSSGCGIGCWLGLRQSPLPDEAKALHANEEAVRTDVADADKKKTSAAQQKPVHAITIAAGGSEVAKLKRLAAALPKEKIKIVAANGNAGRNATDFSVSTDLTPSKAEKAKLFTEQMHIVAGSSVQSVSDLQGKVVSFGPDKGSSQAAARAALEALKIRVQETPLDLDNALDGLSTGDVEAVIILAPQPLERLKSVSTPGVHLVSWPEGGQLPDGAVASAIDTSAYPGLAKSGDNIRAMGVDATLHISEKGAKQGAAKSFLKALSAHSDTLTKRGFDLLKADIDSHKKGHVASADKS